MNAKRLWRSKKAWVVAVVVAIGIGSWVTQSRWYLEASGTLIVEREGPERVRCAGQMQQMGTAMVLYAQDHGGKYPVSLGALFRAQPLEPGEILCPQTKRKVPTTFPTSWYDTDGDYVYRGAGLKLGAPGVVVVMYERTWAHAGDGMNVLFADGHVEFVFARQMERTLEVSSTARQLWEGK